MPRILPRLRFSALVPALAPALAMAAALSCGEPAASAHPDHARPVTSGSAPHTHQDVSVAIESAHHGQLSTHWHAGAAFVAGQVGERYVLRVTNHSSERVEAVVTVDGRDVISGDVGDYRRQRGYVIDPWGEVVIDGFRRSLDHVAAFRFSDASAAYSSRRGTPQHVGVVGVAVFKERRRARPRPAPVRPVERPHVSAEPYPSSPGRAHDTRGPAPRSAGSSDDRAGRDTDEARSAPRKASAPTSGTASGEASGGASRSRGGDGYAPAPRQHNELGTRYGETRTSRVREVDFRRQSRRRPDTVLTVYYDSWEGLVARGVVHEPPPRPYPQPYVEPDPAPFPQSRRFSPPPPGDPRPW